MTILKFAAWLALVLIIGMILSKFLDFLVVLLTPEGMLRVTTAFVLLLAVAAFGIACYVHGRNSR